MESMAAKDILHVIEFILTKEDLVLIREEYAILMSIGLKLRCPFDRVTMGSASEVALCKEVFKAGLRLFLPGVMARLLRWYQVCPTLTSSQCIEADHGILLSPTTI